MTKAPAQSLWPGQGLSKSININWTANLAVPEKRGNYL